MPYTHTRTPFLGKRFRDDHAAVFFGVHASAVMDTLEPLYSFIILLFH